jgi:hypothetical protein
MLVSYLADDGYDGFKLWLHEPLYVSFFSRNLILVSYLADDGYECLFGVKQCLVKFV